MPDGRTSVFPPVKGLGTVEIFSNVFPASGPKFCSAVRLPSYAPASIYHGKCVLLLVGGAGRRDGLKLKLISDGSKMDKFVKSERHPRLLSHD